MGMSDACLKFKYCKSSLEKHSNISQVSHAINFMDVLLIESFYRSRLKLRGIVHLKFEHIGS